MKAVILAGGAGLRLRPLTCDRPKPLVPICNRPVITYTLDLLAEHGIQEVFLTTAYMQEEMRRVLGASHRGMSLRYSVERAPLGTAGSVAALRGQLTETFLVMAGDTLTDADLSALLAFHRHSGSLATLGLKQVADPTAYGVALTDRCGRIRRFVEKPARGEAFSDIVSTGIYVLEPAVLQRVPPGLPFDFGRQLFPAMLQTEAPLHGLVLEGYWCDIGDPAAYLQANLDLLWGRLRFSPPGRKVAPNVWGTAPPAPGVMVEGPAWIGAGCQLMPGARLQGGVVLGPGCVVGTGCTVARSVVWEEVRLEAGACLTGSVVCAGAALGPKAVVYDGAVVGRGCGVGRGAAVAPGVRLWPGSVVEEKAAAEASFIGSACWRTPDSSQGES